MPMKVQWISLLTYSSLHPTCFKMFFARHSDFPFSFKTISFEIPVAVQLGMHRHFKINF